MEEKKKINVVLIFEIIGKPAEHLVGSLKEIIKAIGIEKGVNVISQDVKMPTVLEKNSDFFTTFAEVEIEIEEMSQLAIIMFKYMPAHVDVVSPELITLTNNSWSDVFNELARRLHGYDEIARVMKLEYAKLQKKYNEDVADKKETPEKDTPKETTKKKTSKKK